ncbi:MAG: xanthine dehydrogenase family protein molybdopterin-binding subunit [Nitrospinota bacterium]|nr:MAG: xanthine dehydrogenase family protein molybdopterin-binding subunit [Nitrospinota bacterium]
MSGPTRGEGADRIIGTPMPRHDAVEKVKGTARYAADFHLPGMLYGKVLRSDYPAARITVDTGAAEAIQGVAAVLTARDVPNNTLWVDVPGQAREVQALKARIQVLADKVVRYHGEPIALVAAETPEIAQQALDAIRVEYDPLPVVSDPEEALKPDAPRVHEEGNLLATWKIDKGDVEAALREAAVVVEGTYRTQCQEQAYLEPEAGIGWIDNDGVITLRVSTQVIAHFRDVAQVLGVPQNRVRVICPYVGGGFGGKEDVTVEVFLGLLVLKTQRPVKMEWSRSESLTARPKRHPFIMRYRTAATAEGELLAQDIELLSDAGAYAYLSALVLLYATVTACGPYRVPNVRIRARSVYTNNTPNSAMRGFGVVQPCFAVESQMDQLAQKLHMDPALLRQKNSLRKGDELPVGQRIETAVMLPEIINRVLEAMGPKPAPSGPHKAVGRGLASNLQPYGRIVWLHDWSSAWVGFEMDGTLTIRIGVQDVGGGQASALVQIASEVLGIPPESITIHSGDSALNPFSGTTTATRGLMMAGNAVYQAAREVRRNLVEAASHLLQCPPEAIRLQEGHAVGPEGSVPLTTVLTKCVELGLSWQHLGVYYAPAGDEPQGEEWRGQVFPDYTFGTHACDVEVDRETGQVRILKYVACHDVGRAINRQSVEGQIEGGAVMGIGYALSEQVIHADAVNMTGLFAHYRIPTAMEAPEVISLIVESGEGKGPFQARGIGEPPVGPPAPALANAIADALGVRITELPLLPHRILEALAPRDQ